MKDIIDLYRDVVIQIGTPYSTGTGFFLVNSGLIVTNEHIVRDNKEVIIVGAKIPKQLVKVIYTDPKYDLAFLQPPADIMAPIVELRAEPLAVEGEPVIATGHPFELEYSTTQGIVSNTRFQRGDLNYIQHDAALNPGNSGGPLIDESGKILGVNTFIIKDGNNLGFSLPAHHLVETIQDYLKTGSSMGVRCPSCSNIISKGQIENGYCPHCGTKVLLPDEIEAYEPIGISKTIEEMLSTGGYDVALSRRGPNAWVIQKGSAKINIAYYEKIGLITGDAYLCMLPKESIKDIYEYLLRQNYEIEGLSFSIQDQDIILSLLIYDRYLNVDTGKKLLEHLFEMADYYDNILVEQYGARWKYEDQVSE